MTEQTLDRGEPETLFRFQLGEPVEHRGIVVAPLFPLPRPHRARTSRSTRRSPRGLRDHGDRARRDRARARRRQPARRRRAALRRRGARRREAEPHPQRQRARRRTARSCAIPVSCVEQGRWRSVSPLFSSAGHISHAELRRAKAAALAARSRSRAASRRARSGRGAREARPAWRSPRRQRPTATPSPPTGGRSRASRRVHRRAGAVRRRPRPRGRRSASTPSRARMPSRLLWPKLRAGYLLDALERLDARATPLERIHGFVDEVGQAPAERSPVRRARRVDVRLRGPGVIGSGLELDGELIQLSAFTIEGDRPRRGRIARPSRRSV